jgi:hypothetical protein
MPQTIHRGIKSLVDEANAQIETLSAAEAIEAAQSDDVVIVDIRDPREIEREGRIRPAPMPSRFSRATRNSSFIAPAACARRWRRKPPTIWD